MYIATSEQMEQFGARLSQVTPEKAVIYFHGELGMGKTTLVRGFLRGLGYQGAVKSPTYTLVEPYKLGQHIIYHFDLYRLLDPEELEYIGVRDYFAGPGICLIEWPEQGKGILPQPDISCYIASLSEGRQINLQAYTLVGQQILTEVNKSIRMQNGG